MSLSSSSLFLWFFSSLSSLLSRDGGFVMICSLSEGDVVVDVFDGSGFILYVCVFLSHSQTAEISHYDIVFEENESL